MNFTRCLGTSIKCFDDTESGGSDPQSLAIFDFWSITPHGLGNWTFNTVKADMQSININTALPNFVLVLSGYQIQLIFHHLL